MNNNADLQMLLKRLSEPIKGTQYFLPLGTENRCSGLIPSGLDASSDRDPEAYIHIDSGNIPVEGNCTGDDR